MSTLAKGAGALVALAAASKAKKKVQILQVRSKARKLGVGEPRIDLRQ